jgi:hypothetical protein
MVLVVISQPKAEEEPTVAEGDVAAAVPAEAGAAPVAASEDGDS